MKFKLAILLVLISGGMQFISAQTSGGGVDFLYAKRLFDDAMYDLAAQQFHDFAEQNQQSPQAPEALLLAGDSYFKLKRFEEARKEYVFLILRYPDANNLDQAQFRIGECFRELGNQGEAAKAFHQVKVFYPKSKLAPTAFFEAANMFIQNKQFDLAIEVCYNFLEEYAKDPLALNVQLTLARVFIERGEYARAISEIAKVLETTKQGDFHAQALLLQADVERRLGKIDRAEDIYLGIINEYGDSKGKYVAVITQANLSIGAIYRVKGQYAQSNTYLANTTPTNEVQLMMGDNYFDLNQFDKAIESYRSIEAQEDSLVLRLLFRQGVCHEKLLDFPKAIESFQKVLTRCEEITDTPFTAYCENSYIAIAKNYLQSGNAQVALKYLKDYQIAFPAGRCLDQAKFKIAEIYEHQLFDYERALRLYYDFEEEFPSSQSVDDAQLGVARCYENLKNIEQAIKEYQKYLKLYPGAAHYDEAESKVAYFDKFSIPKETGALTQLAALLGDVIHNPEQDVLTYKLALTYYHELKDYPTAISLLRKSIRTSEKLPEDEYLYYLASAYLNLSEKDYQEKAMKSAHVDSAQRYSARLIAQFPESQYSDDATIVQLKSRLLQADILATKNKIAKEILTAFLITYPQSAYRDYALFNLASAYVQDGLKTAADSSKAVTHFQQLLTEFPQSPFAGAAQFHLAQVYMDRGDRIKAQAELLKYLQQFPQGRYIVQAHYLLARILSSDDKDDDALIYLKKIINDYFYSPYADSAQINIGDLYVRTEKYADGIEFFRQRLSADEFSCYLHDLSSSDLRHETTFRLGQFHQKSGDNNSAIAYFQQYLRRFPLAAHLPEVLFALGELYQSNKSADQNLALGFFRRLLTEFPTDKNVYQANCNLGDIFFNRGDYSSAREYYSNAIKAAVSNDKKLYPAMQAIICLYRADMVAKGDAELTELKKNYNDIDDYLAQIELAKGDYYFDRKFFDTSEEIYKAARAKFKKNEYGILAELKLGRQYLTLNKDEEALKILTEMPKKYPESNIIPDVFLSLGEFYYFKARQPENAMLAFKNAIDHPAVKEQSLLQGMNNLIKTYFDLGMLDQALTLSRKYIELAPLAENAFDIRIQIGIIYNKLNEYDRAIDHLKQLKREADSESEPRIQFWIADSYWEKGYFEKAIIEYLKVRYISKPSKLNWAVTAQYKAGLAYMKLGKLDEARRLMEKIVLEQGAESPFGKGALKKIEEIQQMSN